MATQNQDAPAESQETSTTKRTRKAASNGNKGRRTMSQEHKDALARGRTEGKIVTDYLSAIESSKPKRGRPVTTESIKERLNKVNAEIAETTGVHRLKLIQKRMDLEADLRRTEDTNEVEKLQADFVKVAKSYAERSGMTYAAFREFGVPVPILKEAGLSR